MVLAYITPVSFALQFGHSYVYFLNQLDKQAPQKWWLQGLAATASNK